jgi:hypothetical protein
MTAKFGPLGFQPADRYRNIAESRIVDTLVLAGWPYEPESPAARDAAQAVLEAWIRTGVGFRPTANGMRLFDPVEVYNHMKLAGVEERDGFFFEKFSRTRRKFIADLAVKAPGRFTFDFQRTFHLQAVVPEGKLRLRIPLPLTGEQLSDLQVTPLTETARDAQVVIAPGRLEARLLAGGKKTALVGATLSFNARPHEPAAQPPGAPDDAALYLASREGLVVLSDRIRALAHSLAAKDAPALEAIRAFWDFIYTNFRCGMVHYDQVNLAAPGDWVLDSGWLDCQLASALFVALCRARGIPARLVNGYLLYPPAPTNHFWTEAWIDTQGWTPFDFFGWDLSDAGRLPEWRDRFFGQLDPRLTTERLPREFTGAIGVPIPSAWCILQTPAPGGVEIGFLDISGEPVYTDLVRVTT